MSTTNPTAGSDTVTGAGVRIVTRTKLKLSRDPSAELAAAALQASDDAGLEHGTADYLVVAVPAGAADDTLARALTDAIDRQAS